MIRVAKVFKCSTTMFVQLCRWNNALVLTPNNEKLYEMKAQVLMILEQVC